jgi:hypothetical protein
MKERLLVAMPRQAGIESPRKLYPLCENASNLVIAVRTTGILRGVTTFLRTLNFAKAGKAPLTLNDAGDIVGFLLDSGLVFHGFVRTP